MGEQLGTRIFMYLSVTYDWAEGRSRDEDPSHIVSMCYFHNKQIGS